MAWANEQSFKFAPHQCNKVPLVANALLVNSCKNAKHSATYFAHKAKCRSAAKFGGRLRNSNESNSAERGFDVINLICRIQNPDTPRAQWGDAKRGGAGWGGMGQDGSGTEWWAQGTTFFCRPRQNRQPS